MFLIEFGRIGRDVQIGDLCIRAEKW